MDPVRMAIEVLNDVKRSAQGHQNRHLFVAFVQSPVGVQSVDCLLRVCQQVDKDVVELPVAVQRAVQVVEMQEDGGPANLAIASRRIVVPERGELLQVVSAERGLELGHPLIKRPEEIRS